ncbi:Ivy family c-type lysozyme inhibitor [Alcaligenes sp. SDU_A2]|uniref:Ivy family c-type lysozyme inhibitor n=1 Tax=Alcaligenes sp. SDU_A2 TaxID=3136634 RepID=UPI002BAD7C41|nr:Ivy family c-type lysozyme inhibitor [Alcaligenes sp.]HRL27507.1 Ivy family c-type lysozyme inhibitor [Alcaligenes sp.]
MRISHFLCRLLAGGALLVPLLATAQSDAPVYLADLASTNKHVADQYRALMRDVAKRASWVNQYGTASPAETVSVDGRNYHLFRACKPHNCPSESYVVLLDAQKQTLAHGAFVENKTSGPGLASSRVQWLGEPDTDLARHMAAWLF